MPTFREDTKIGGMVPMMKTDDINDQAITKDKIRDGNVTAEKLADGAVSTDKLPDGAIKTPKIADENITTSKLAEASVVTSKIADQNVTKEKIADQSIDNSKLSPEAVTYDKLKDKSVITEKLNDRAVTTEKVEEKAITNAKLGDQSVDGRVVRAASIESKHIGNNAVSTSKIASRSVTNEKIAQNSVSRAELDPDVRSSIDKKADAEQVNNSLYDLEKKIGERFVVEGDVTNLPDEEDLTSVKESERDVLKLADRSYAPYNFSGKGYKILRRNIKPVSIAVTKIRVESVPLSDGTLSFTINGKETQVAVSATTDNTTALVAQKVAAALQDSMTEYDVSIDASLITLTRKSNGSVTPSVFSASTTGVVCTITDSTKKEFRNILTPAMINQPNTIYEIRYDFDLDGKNIKVPDNSTIKFVGGSFNNGELNPNDCYVVNDIELCVFYNIIFTKYSMFNEKLLFQDYWIDNIFKSGILAHINNFNVTKSHICNIQSEFGIDSVNLSKSPIIIFGNNNSIIINTNDWVKPKKAISLISSYNISIYDLNLIQNQPTSVVVDVITVYFTSKIFHFINSYYLGFCRLNANWSYTDIINGEDKGVNSELKFIDSCCNGYSFISEGRFDKVIIRNSSILRLYDRPDFTDKVWGKECLSIGGDSVSYTNKNDCYIHITNSQLRYNIEEVSRNFTFNENGDRDVKYGWDGISNKGYTYILVENCNLDHCGIAPEGACNNGKWCVYSTTVEFRNCTLYDSRSNTNKLLTLNGHNKYIFNNCIMYEGVDIFTAHEIEFNNCTLIDIVIKIKDYKFDNQELKLSFNNCIFDKSSISIGNLYTFSEFIEHIYILNCYNKSEFSHDYVLFADKTAAYIPFVNLKFTNDYTKYKALSKTGFMALYYNNFGQNYNNYKPIVCKVVYYDPIDERFKALDETDINYITY